MQNLQKPPPSRDAAMLDDFAADLRVAPEIPPARSPWEDGDHAASVDFLDDLLSSPPAPPSSEPHP
jgi:hypothetical protein